MKKIIIFLLVIAIVGVQPIFAQEKISTESGSIEYQLPYPGLLPDSPLYFLKIFRDRLIDFLVADPLKKAELNLLHADKRLAAGEMLFAKGKKELAESTISKSENYLESGIVKLKETKKQGMDITGLTQKFSISVKKHKQIVQNLIQKSTGETKRKLQDTDKRILEFEKQVNGLSPK